MSASETKNKIDPIVEALRDIVNQNRYSAMQTMRIIYNYEPNQNIELWLRLFDAKADRLGLHDGLRIDQLPSYLPIHIAQWILSNPELADDWAKTKKALIDTYGIPIAQQKLICRKKLEALRQGHMPSRQFKAAFQSIVQELPSGASFPTELLRSIYLGVMNPRLLDKVISTVTTSTTWEEVADKAIVMDEVLNADPRLAEAYLYSNGPVESLPHTIPASAPPSGPTPMEIDAFQRRPGVPNRGGNSSRGSPNKFNQWVRPGVPLCGHCGKEGHLSKRCRMAKKKNSTHVHALEKAVDSSLPTASANNWQAYGSPAPATVPLAKPLASRPEVNYCAVPMIQDPLYETARASINNLEISSSAADVVATTQVASPKLQCTINGISTTCLVDTGANISAIRKDLATQLGLLADDSNSIVFATAAGTSVSTHGSAMVNICFGSLVLPVRCHIVDNLSQPVIFGYDALQQHRAIIDACTNEVRFSSVSGSSGSGSSGDSSLVSGSSGSVVPPAVPCKLQTTLKLPAQSHCYTEISGPANSVCMVSTPSNLVADKLVSVAAGVVRFDESGVATVKIANLDVKAHNFNKNEIVAFTHYLPSSTPTIPLTSLVNNSPTTAQIASLSASAATSSSNPLEFDPVLGECLTTEQAGMIKSMLSEFSDCFDSEPNSTTHLVQHHIDTGDERPVASPPHRASAAENDTINGLIDEMLQQGVIRPSRSPWSSPVVLVPKPDGSVRFCVDYRRLNDKTTKDVYPLTRIDDALHSLGSARYFSTMDLTSSYWQIELDDESKPKSAFVCRRGLFEFIRMPFGLCTAPATMQRLMDSVLAGLKWQTCLVYLDDIICFSPTFDQHLKDLREIFQRLRSASLKVKLKKCSFGSDRISFLGYVLSPDGLHTDPDKIRAVSEFPVPSSVEDVRSFLGLAGYYRCFISNFSAIAAPLNDLLKKDSVWAWTSAHQKAYNTLKNALVSAPVLRFPDFSRPFELHTDGACTAGIGVILGQRDPHNHRVYAVAYASRSLSPAERNYGVSEVEALAIVWGIQKFAHYLTGTKFTVVTDHHALQFLRNTRSSNLRGRLARWALALQQMDFDIVYRPGRQNAGPDALSRHPIRRDTSKAFISALTAPDLASSQAADPFCQKIYKTVPLPREFTVSSGVLFFGPRPVLPDALREEMFQLLHSNSTSGHLGLGRTLQRFARLFYAPGLHNWVKDKVSRCETCLRVKSSNTTLGHTNLKHSDPAVHPFDSIAIDTYGPLPTSRSGNRYIIVIQDLFSRFVVLNAVPENSSKWVITCLNKVFATHGIVRSILSDNGQPYASALLKDMANQLGIQQKFTPAYHPQANGLVERFMATLRNMIVSFMDPSTNLTTWDEHLEEFQLAYNSSPHDATKFSPFSVVFGREARLLGQPDLGVKAVSLGDYHSSLQESLSRAHAVIQLENIRSQAGNAIRYNTQRVAPSFTPGDQVLVKFPVLSNAAAGRSAKLSPSVRGPFIVAKILGSDRFDIFDPISNKTHSNVHAERLKKFPTRNEDIPRS